MRKQILTILTILSLSLIMGAGHAHAESETESEITLGAISNTAMMEYGTGGH